MRDKILKNLAQNARLSSKDLAAMLDSSPEEIKAMIQQMEDEGIICGYPTLINWDKTGDERVTAVIEVKTAPERGRGFDKIAARIYQFDEVKDVYLMSGNFDFTVIIDGSSMKEVARFVTQKLAPMESVVSCATYFVLKKYKEHGIPLEKIRTTDERQLITP
ncbi:MAG: Lrp/AsnC family transcriptional regulator [Eubacterium sp.]|nr:Lrp/AsnC family transcriptional regulator [Eubacterium sp.]